jgi:hypothetical protein
MGRRWSAEPTQVRLRVGMARLRRRRLRWAIAGGLVIVLVAAAIVAWPYVGRHTG